MNLKDKGHSPDKEHEKKESKHSEGASQDKNSDQKILSMEEYEQLTARLKELEGLRERLVVNAADFENAKKRLAREKEEFLKFGQENLIRSMLPVLDNFGRALAHKTPDGQGAKNILVGIEMIFKQLSEIMKAQGVQKLETVGKIFDPHFHEAIAYVQEPGTENEIIDEIEPGYVLHDRLLRAAKVRVRASHAPEDAPQDSAEEDQEGQA